MLSHEDCWRRGGSWSKDIIVETYNGASGRSARVDLVLEDLIRVEQSIQPAAVPSLPCTLGPTHTSKRDQHLGSHQGGPPIVVVSSPDPYETPTGSTPGLLEPPPSDGPRDGGSTSADKADQSTQPDASSSLGCPKADLPRTSPRVTSGPPKPPPTRGGRGHGKVVAQPRDVWFDE